jgi:ribosomal protein L36
MEQIYVLELAEKKYYVGKTKNSDMRIGQHIDGDGSVWTSHYKPLQVVELVARCDDFDEDKYTLKYMAKHGIANVRGGSFCNLELNDNEKMIIQKMLNGAQDLCYTCNNSGHFAKNCKSEIIKITQITYEHQRWYPLIGWSSNLLPTDRPQFSSKDGANELRKESFVLQPGQQIISEWRIDTEGCGNTEGWYYAFVFQDPVYNLTCESDNFVKRRKWMRIISSLVPKHQPSQSRIRNIDENDKPNWPEEKIENAKKLEGFVEHLGSFFESSEDREPTTNKRSYKNNAKCFRCGRFGHFKAECYAKKHVDTNKILNPGC